MGWIANMRRWRKIEFLVAWVLFGLGLLFLAFTAGSGITRAAFLAEARPTEGKVVGVLEDTDDEGNPEYMAIVAFFTRGGGETVFTNPLRSSKIRYDSNSQVRVLYPPKKPGRALIGDFDSLWTRTVIHGIFAALFLGAGILQFAKPWKPWESKGKESGGDAP